MFDNHPDSTVKEEVAELRAELHTLMEEFGLGHSKVLEFSRKLDLLILEYSNEVTHD